MVKKPTTAEPPGPLDRLRLKFRRHSDELWQEFQRKFESAINDSEKRRINLVFTATVDLSEDLPILMTVLAFKDKTMEDGMNVTKTFKSPAKCYNSPDPRQTALPGISPEED